MIIFLSVLFTIVMLIGCYYFGNKFNGTTYSKKINDRLQGFFIGFFLIILLGLIVGTVYAICYSVIISFG